MFNSISLLLMLIKQDYASTKTKASACEDDSLTPTPLRLRMIGEGLAQSIN